MSKPQPNKGSKKPSTTAKKNIPCPKCRERLTPTRPLVAALGKRLFGTGVDVHHCKRCRHMIISAGDLDRAMLSFVKQQIAAKARVPKELRKEFVVRLPESMKERLAKTAENESKSANAKAVELLAAGLGAPANE